ncbi:HINT domain-containing protein [Frankia gtarii]|uniref:HINT domain-containing protein n=1 Tax=Frankia gtarii TaxID=2950102 RepID=UPI0021BED046|nr:HINT domain-containing protein [Frankia gtarii]
MALESCTPNSFDGDTAVLMADGTRKRIRDVRVGDRVLATDPVTGRTEARTVTALIVGQGLKHLVAVSVDTGRGSATLTATDHHPFWDDVDHGWVDADDLAPVDELRTPTGSHIRVTATREYDRTQTVYNLTVDTLHTYYVLAGTTPVLVHNCNRVGLNFTDSERQKVYDANEAKNSGVLKCDYCGQDVVRRPSARGTPGLPNDAQVDHIEPRVSGGHGGAHNGAVACRRCNRDKSTKSLEDWDDELRDFLGY